jgi:hypothetical protein
MTGQEVEDRRAKDGVVIDGIATQSAATALSIWGQVTIEHPITRIEYKVSHFCNP